MLGQISENSENGIVFTVSVVNILNALKESFKIVFVDKGCDDRNGQGVFGNFL